MQQNSKFIAIEGLDGAGKSTQIKLLEEYFNQQGIATRFVHFPRHNEGVFGKLITRFLRGEFGDVGQVHPQLVALMFAEDRKDYAQTINEWQEQGYVVLVDRYVLSNIAFQCAKLKIAEEKTALRKWINEFEYEYNRIPQPDLSIFLDVPFSFTEKALTQRMQVSARDYLNGKEDIHEKDFSLQLAVKKEYELLSETDPTITRIICYEGEAMKPIEAIHEEIVKRINNRL